MALHGRRRAARSGPRYVPVPIWAITGLWCALLLGASILWPPLYGYDEPAHFDMAYAYSAAPFHFYGPGQLHLSEAVSRAEGYLPANPPRPALDEQPVVPRPQRPTLAALGGNDRPSTTAVNQMVQHPPLYYEIGALVLRIPGVSSLGWDLQVWLLRLVSIVFMAPVPILCWLGTKRLLDSALASDDGAALDDEARPPRYGAHAAVLGALLPLTIPNMIRDGASVTNDSLLILTFSVVLYGVIRVLTGDRSLRTAAWISVSLLAALLTKGFALVLPPVVVLAYVVGGVRHRRGWLDGATWRPMILSLVGAAVGGLWWARNLVDYGAVQDDGFGSAASVKTALYGRPDNTGTLTRFIPQFTSDVISRIWGGIGLADVPSLGPLIVWGWFLLVVIGLLAAGITRSRARRPVLVLLLVPVLVFLVVAEGSFGDYRHWSNYTHGSQGRYLYQTVVVVAAAATLGWRSLLQPRVRARLTTLTLLAALVTNAVAWFLILHSWYSTRSGLHGLLTGAHAVLHWSPVPEGITILLVVILPALGALLAVVAVLAESRRLAAWEGHPPRGETDHDRAGSVDVPHLAGAGEL